MKNLPAPVRASERIEGTPLLSFIVLSYNYQDYIRTTLQSILTQTVQDFEVIVVDDSSSDQSCEVVRSFKDPRIRLIVNDRNLGGAGSYNVAVQAARGEWLVNLDADDWIAPEKSVRQLKFAAKNPSVDIVGTWVNLVDADGKPHPDAPNIELGWNNDYALNLTDTWIGKNHLCRSSTMVRRAAHLRIGLDDEGMVAAPDYELWTRALAQGCRFGVVKERLTFSRLHSRGVTRADLVRSLLEMTFALQKNIVPLISKRALWPTFAELFRWVGTHYELPGLSPRERERLLGLLFTGAVFPTYADFRAALNKTDPMLETVGRRALFIFAQAEAGRAQDDWSLSLKIEELKNQLNRAVEDRDQLKAKIADWQHKSEVASMPTSLTHHNSSQGFGTCSAPQPNRGAIHRIKRWIAPGTGRWVRVKSRLARVEQRLLRFFHSL